MNEHDDDEMQAPAKLAKALGHLQKERVFVPPHLDERILNQARAHLEVNTRNRSFLPAWAAIAAVLILSAGVIAYFNSPMQMPVRAAEDLNKDGQVDILDAFLLAQQVQKKHSETIDFNGDGKADQKDAESLAIEAVRLKAGGRS